MVAVWLGKVSIVTLIRSTISGVFRDNSSTGNFARGLFRIVDARSVEGDN
jgi:hypothetical protein